MFLSKKTTDTNTNDVSLDEILSSIRSVVMDEIPEVSERVSQEVTLPNPLVHEKKKTSVKRKNPVKKGTAKKISKKTSAKKASAKKASAKKTKAKKTKHNAIQGASNLPVKAFLLTDILEMGTLPVDSAIVSSLCQHKIEDSIYDLIDTITANKDSLPKEFYEKQDQVIEAWLNQYLPHIVEKQVQKEIRRIGNNIMKNS